MAKARLRAACDDCARMGEPTPGGTVICDDGRTRCFRHAQAGTRTCDHCAEATDSPSTLGDTYICAGCLTGYEFLIVGAPGWPGGYRVWPPTAEAAKRFVKEHGGEIRTRLRVEWEPIQLA